MKKIKGYIDDVSRKIKKYYRGLTPNSKEGWAVREMGSTFDKLQEIFAQALAEASETYRNAGRGEAGAAAAQARGEVQKQARGSTSDNKKTAYEEWQVETALYDALDHADAGDDNLIHIGDMPHFITEKLGISGDFYVYRDHVYENMVTEEQAENEKRFRKKAHYHGFGIEKMIDAIMGLENPLLTIATQSSRGNPAVIILLPVEGNLSTPLYAVLSFYDDKDINGDFSRKPHIVLTIAERNAVEDGGRVGLSKVIDNAVLEKRVLSFDKKTRDYLTVNTKATSLGIITDKSLTDNIAAFRAEINRFGVLSFYTDKPINGDYSRKPHIVLTIAERAALEEGGRSGWSDIIDNAIREKTDSFI